MNTLYPTSTTITRIAGSLLFFVLLFTVLPCLAKKSNPSDTLENERNTIPVIPKSNDDFFSFPMFKNPFFEMGLNFDSSFVDLKSGLSGELSSKVNFDVRDKTVIVTAQIPGSDKNSIDVKVTKSSISIHAEMKTEKTVEDDKGNVISRSTQLRQFKNSQPLPVEVKPKVVKTDYKNGLLVIELSRI